MATPADNVMQDLYQRKNVVEEVYATIVEQSSSKGYSPSEENHEENKEDSDSEGFHEGHSRMAPEPYFGLSNFQSKLQDNVVAVIEDFISSFGILGNSTAVSQSSETSK
jgi:hypothetical protein